MTHDTPANDLVDSLKASSADIGEITVKQTSDRVTVQFNLLNEDDIELVRELADKHGYKRAVDGISLFELHKERKTS